MMKLFLLLLISLMHCSMFGSNVLVYNDEGVDQTGLQWTLTFFKNRGDDVSAGNADFLINDTTWIYQYNTLIIPGGADRPYYKNLKGTGCDNIKKFVKNGGTYIGICAGGYFGCQKIEFAKGTELEICEDRELGFFPGVARGPMLKQYVYNSDEGASAAKIRSSIDGSIFYAYHNGGSTFILDGIDTDDVAVLAEYVDTENMPAVIKCKYGNGTAILCGIHFEAMFENDSINTNSIAEKISSTSNMMKKFLDNILNP